MAYATPLFVPSATPFFRSFATRTFATPKNLSLILEALVDKEVAKLVEEVNEELVMDVVVEGVVDKLVEVNKELVMDVVVEEVNRELLKEFNWRKAFCIFFFNIQNSL